MQRRIFVKSFGFAVSAGVCGLVNAQVWPSKPVRVVIPFPAGTTPDVLARVLFDRVGSRLGQPFVIDNRPGASGNIGTDAVAKAPPDGYTIGLTVAGPLVLNPLLFKAMPYDPARDLKLITIAASQPSVLVASNKLSASSASDLISLLDRKGGRYGISTIGTGTISQMAMYLLTAGTQADLVQVPFGGSGAAATALMAGEVDVALLPAAAVVPYVLSEKMKALGVADSRRMAVLPSVPTLREAGLPSFPGDAWIGVVAPAKTPDVLTHRLREEIVRALAEPDIRQKLQAQYMNGVGNTPAEFQKVLEYELSVWSPVIRRHGISIQ